ncbi:MAG: phenylacetate--CoA ligase family protein [Candidatus Vogelbacteria bacterium]|nr:phenylacetate--CoA ligase family protein [Candidatus Vogelbacteria bacterium]
MSSYSLNLFHKVAQSVPAYKDFLKKNKIDPKKVKNFVDLQSVPVISKQNYLRKYSLTALCFDGKLDDKAFVFTATSGSTGTPFYFPRDEVLDWQYSYYLELFINNLGPGRKKRSTLVVDAFGMGVWIGGLITYQAWRMLALRGYPITIITPGINKKEIFDAFQNLAGNFDQVILCGYPPFVKDIIDEGELVHGIKWKEFNIKFLFAAEAFGENYRNYLVKKTGIKNVYRDMANVYGSADLGAMAIETPVSILARRVAVNNERLFVELFKGATKIPTLAQFDPRFINFEAPEGVVLCTGYNALPLVRYAIGDHGGIMSMKELLVIFKNAGVDLMKECRRVKIEKTVKDLPFVYVYERLDFSTKLFGAIIYPEHVKRALEHSSIQNFLTGKFSMSTEVDADENQYLYIHLEMKIGVKESRELSDITCKLIVESLNKNNAEYKNNYQTIPEKVTPRLSFWTYEHPNYFKPGTKQKYVI